MKPTKPTKPILLFLLSSLTFCLVSPAARAASTGFNQTAAGPFDYNTAGNWAGSTINGLWNTDLTLAAAQTVTFAADTTLTTGLTFNYAGIFGLTLNSDSATVRTLTLGGDINLNTSGASANVTLGKSTNPLNVDLGSSSRTLTVAASRALTFVNPITSVGGSFGITKAGTGTLTLSGANTYSGGTTVSAGTLTIGANSTPSTAGSTVTAGPIGTGSVTLAGGTLQGGAFTLANNIVAQNASTSVLQLNGGNFTLNGNLSGGGTVNAQYSGSGTFTMTLGGDNSGFTGTFTQVANNGIRYSFGTANSGSASALWVLNNTAANNSGLGFGFSSGTIFFGALSGSGNMRGGGFTINIGGMNANASWGGNISSQSGVINVIKSGTGAETFSAAQTYSGTTTIQDGSLIAGNATAFGSASSAIGLGDAITVSSATAMNAQLYNGGAFTMARPVTVGANNNVLGNASTLFTLGGNSASSSTFSGAISLNQSLVVTQVASGSLVLSGGITAGSSGSKTVTFNNPGSVNVTTTAIGNGSGTVGLTKAGAGTLTLTTANTYTGATLVSGGTLQVSTAGTGIAAGSAVTVGSSATLQVDSGATVAGTLGLQAGATLKGAGTIGGAVTLDSGNAAINLQTSAANTLAMSSGLTLNGGNVLTLDIATAGSDQIAVTGPVTLPVSGVVTVNVNNIGGNGITAPGTIKLISATTGTMDYTKFSLATAAPTGYTWQLQNDVDGHSLDLVIALTAPAAAFWKGGVDNNWNTADSSPNFNWATDSTGGTSTGAKPGGATVVTFSATGVNNLSTVLGGNFEIGSLAFNSASGNVTIGGANTLQVNGNLTLNAGAGTVSVTASSYVLGGEQTVANNSSSALTISSPISGAHTLTVNSTGSGSTTLFGANSHTGTTVSSGTLNLSGSGTLGSSSAAVSVSGGTLDLGATSQTLGTLTVLGGTVQNGSVSGTSYAIQGGTVAATLNGSGVALTKTTSDTATLSGNNGYTGGTTVSAGTLVLSGDNTAVTGVTTVSGTLQLQNANAIASSALTLNSGSTLSLQADSDTTFNNGGVTAFAGGNTYNFKVDALTAGTGHTLTFPNLTGTSVGAASPTINVSSTSGDTLSFGSTAFALSDNSGSAFGGTATFLNLNNANVVMNGLAQASGGFNGYIVLASSSPANSLTINGTATTGNNRTLGAQVNSGTLTLNNTVTLNGGNNYGFWATLNGGTLNWNNAGAIFAEKTDGVVYALTIAGGTLDNTSGSALAVSPVAARILKINGDFAFSTAGGTSANSLNLGLGAVFLGDTAGTSRTISVHGSSTLTIGGVISSGTTASALIKAGTGTLALTGANSYTGGTTVNGGKLAVSSALTGTTATGVVTVNDGGTLQTTVSGSSQLTPSALSIGTPAGSGATLEFVNVSSTTTPPINPTTLTINGTLTVNIASLPSLATGTYPLVANYAGGTVSLGTLPARITAHLDTSGGQIALVVDSVTPDVWAAGTGSWNTSLANWKTNGFSMIYADGDPVVFDDNAPGTVTITPSSVSPTSVTFNNTGNNSYNLAGAAIAGSASLIKTGNGTVTLLNTNTYTGGTFVNVGTLQLGDGSSANGEVAGNITANATLVVANPVDQTIANTISGSGDLIKTSAGALTISGANNSFSGTATIKQGLVNVSTVNNLGSSAVVLGDSVVGADATLNVSSAITLANSITAVTGSGERTLSMSGTANFSGGTATLNHSVTLAKSSSGDSHFAHTLTGSGNVMVTNSAGSILWMDGPSSSWTGAFIIQAGSVRPGTSSNPFNSSTVLSISANNSANFNVGGINADLTFAGINDIPGATGGGFGGGSIPHDIILAGSGDYVYSGVFSSASWGLRLAMGTGGKQTLTGNNTYSGATTINSGTLLVNGSLASASAVSVNGGTLGGTGTIGGAVVVNTGGTLAPGAGGIGTITLGNTLTFASGSAASFEINKAAGPVYSADKAAVTGAITFGGTLSVVSNANSAAFALGDSFTLFTGSSFSGWFSSVTLPPLPSDLTWDTNNLATAGYLDVYDFRTNALQTMVALKNTATTLKISKLTAKTTGSRGTVGVQSVSSGSGATVGISGADITYTPPLNFTGTDTFTAILGDGHGRIAATVVVTVSEANVGPALSVDNGYLTNGGNGSFTASGMPGVTYAVEVAPSLSGPWSAADNATVTASATGFISYTDTKTITAYGGVVFYRLRQP